MKDSVERIKRDGNSFTLLDLVRRMKGSTPRETASQSSGGTMEVILSENEKGLVVIRNDDGWLRLDNKVERVRVCDGVGNDRDLTEWELADYSMLKELVVGNGCVPFVKDLKIDGLGQLEKVEVGADCFCKASGGVFELVNCPLVRSVSIGDGSFVRTVRVVFESACLGGE